MGKPIRIIIGVIIGLALISIFLGVFGNSKLNQAIREMHEAEKVTESVLKHLNTTQAKLDLIVIELNESKKHIEYIQGIVELTDTEKRIKDTKDKTKVDSLLKRKKELEIANTKFRTDSTTDIIIKK